MIEITGSNFIAGEQSTTATAFFEHYNPRTREPNPQRFPNATAAEIDRAVQAAQAAYQQSRTYSAEQLAVFLERIAQEIEALGDDLITTADAETALGFPRLTGERGRTTGQLRAFAALLREGSYVEAIIDTAQPDRQPAPRPDMRRMLFPLGPVAVFAASNFPFAFSVAGGDTASAFAAGCPVILKAHPGHPATSELVAHAIYKAIDALNLPRGMFSMLHGTEARVGQEIVQHPGVAAVGFTGSLRAGRAIFDTAAARPTPIPVYAEMGSVNPVVIMPQAIAERSENLAEGLVNSITLGSGQFCTNPGLIFVIDSEATQQFIRTVADKMQAKAPGILLNGQIEQGLARAVDSTRQHQAITLLTGGEAVSDGGYCYSNTVMQTDSAAFRADHTFQTEHFGPVTLFVVCESMGDLAAALNTLEGNLTATIHAQDSEISEAGTLYSTLREKVGRLIWNGFPTGVEVVYSQQHGGPYPATSAPATTSVGMTAIKRFMRPVAFQNMPQALLPEALQDANPLHIWRIVDGQHTRD